MALDMLGEAFSRQNKTVFVLAWGIAAGFGGFNMSYVGATLDQPSPGNSGSVLRGSLATSTMADIGPTEMAAIMVPEGVTVPPHTTEIANFVYGDKANGETRSSVKMVILERLTGKTLTVLTLATQLLGPHIGGVSLRGNGRWHKIANVYLEEQGTGQPGDLNVGCVAVLRFWPLR